MSRALSVHTEIYSPNESIWLQMVRSLLFFPPTVSATERNEDRLDGWLVSVSGSVRQSITADPRQQTATDTDQTPRGVVVDYEPKITVAHRVPAESQRRSRGRIEQLFISICSVAFLVLRDIYNRSGMSFLFFLVYKRRGKQPSPQVKESAVIPAAFT